MLALMLPLILQGPIQTPPRDLSRLGNVWRFISMRPVQDTLGGFNISNDGTRVYVGSNPLFTWEVGPNDDRYFVHGYSLDSGGRPEAASWRATPGGGFVPRVSGGGRFAGLLSRNRPVMWHSTSQPYRVVLVSFDVSERAVSGSGPVLFYRREQMTFEQFDVPNMILYVRAADKKLRAFKIGDDHNSSREIALPARARRYVALGDYVTATVGYRWAVKADNSYDPGTGRVSTESAMEYDLSTGRGTRLPLQSTSPHSFLYVGDDLFYYEQVLLRDAAGEIVRNAYGEARYTSDLWLWDREARTGKRIGRYSIAGISPDGRFMIVRDGERFWMMRRWHERWQLLDL